MESFLSSNCIGLVYAKDIDLKEEVIDLIIPKGVCLKEKMVFVKSN